ncbi:MAG: glycosyltransferase family 4 protein [Candidatus Thiodiazotropha sp. (ex Myrtea sp. 'scaly one' KF741663)]|nr:glycosyltransferase family 4 protein [Candidatus Thiodiazotropha sp. (ex Myrtea sp. 'scaly one' KF741663)]
MNILIVTQYFWPETFIINELASQLSKFSHTVTVLTGKPNYPEGKIFQGYRSSGLQSEKTPGGIQVHRVPLRPRYAGGTKNLALNYLSFLYSGLIRFPRLIRGQRYDAIIFFAPSPMTSAITAIPIKYLTKSHLAIWIQDLWPESLTATGHVSKPIILLFIKQIVRLIYRFADTLLIQSKAFSQPVSKMAAADKIVYYPNFSSANIEKEKMAGAQLPPAILQTLDENFCLVFSGNLGTAQALETLLEAAEHLQDLTNLKILLVGSGSMSDRIEEKIQEKRLRNLILTGRLVVEMMPQLYQHAEGLLVLLKDEEIFSYTVPSKVQAYLAAAKPILASINGETARIIDEAGAGLTSRAEDASGLADSIRKLYHSTPEERAAMGRRGHEYFVQHFELESQTRRLVEILQQRITKE